MSIDIENTGDKCGKEVVQLYVAMPTSEVIRPIKELRRFEKIELAPREKKTVKFTLNGRDFSYWNAEIHDWLVESGCYQIQFCKNVNDVIIAENINVCNTKNIPLKYTENTCLGDLQQNERTLGILMSMFEENLQATEMKKLNKDSSGAINDEMMNAMMQDMPIRQLLSFVPGITRESIQQMIKLLNEC